ncbi:hypothetical protein JM946_05605 [Steroidobacter sp. S1-65]|uniref:Uncharacterized protein n=1 Tax=Steroidobacter gossypii TaxID=2805490 RepID=A0ABS1WTA6_9GAMM|nr:hypothetical protein [Steroidobacter gossypii]
MVLQSCKVFPERSQLRDSNPASIWGLSAAMQSCSEGLFFMWGTLRLARDDKVSERVKNA